MGCSISIDSIYCIDKKIHSIVFPITPYKNTLHNRYIITETGKLISLVVHKPKFSINKIILYSHGNSETNYNIYDYFMNLSKTLNIKCITYDYIGYGKSEGIANENNCYESHETVVKYIQNHYNDQIILMGSSLGTGVIIDYVSKNKWLQPIILISPFKSIPRVAFDNKISDVLISKYKFNNMEKIKKIICPIKIFHGYDDNIVPLGHAIFLFNLMPNKSMDPYFLKNTGHNDILYKIPLKEFIQVINWN